MSALSQITKPAIDAVKPEIAPEQIESSKLGEINAALEAAWLKAEQNISNDAAKQIVLQKIGEALVYVANEIKLAHFRKMRDKLEANK
jgi:hypothetical protein